MKYKFLSFLFALAVLASCVYEDELPEFPGGGGGDGGDAPESFKNGYSLNITVTLDNMGGETSTKAPSTLSQLREVENYINPEKFRVLFFDRDDKFLFESKSRWIKKLSDNSDHSSWLVSVPFFSYGNDASYNWNWTGIRQALTKDSRKEEDKDKTFKIAILANRPGLEWCPKFEDTNIDPAWIDNSGPYWNADDSGVKTVFDLHHCQYDPIYTGKSWSSDHKKEGNEGFYEFIMGVDASASEARRLTMGATSSWVEWGLNDEGNRDSYGWDFRYFKLPSQDYPIPMYGIQEFDAIENWTEGTPFNLSSITANGDDRDYKHKTISLLRSVVKLELLIPKSMITNNSPLNFVSLWYPNVYARCEPMDVWTPTDQLWKDDHDNDCEWKSIMNYGRVTRSTDPMTDAESFDAYRERLSWFYGAWLDKDNSGKPRWNFTNGGSFNENRVVKETASTPYPRIFNPCIQRNNTVLCDKVRFDDGNYYRYVVYTGERNINDPSNLAKMGDSGSGKPTIIYWMFNVGATLYNIPIMDYGKYTPATVTNGYTFRDKPTNTNSGLDDYMQAVQNVGQPALATEQLPWPLLRNHVYRLTVASRNTSAYPTKSGRAELVVTSEDCHTPDINFGVNRGNEK